MSIEFENRLMVRMHSNSESGATLLETLVALAIMGVIAVVFLGGLAATSKVNYKNDEFGTAVSLAELEIESVREAPYVFEANQYPALPVPEGKDYLGYSVAVAASPLHSPDDGIQKIIIDITRFGKQVFRLESYKVDR